MAALFKNWKLLHIIKFFPLSLLNSFIVALFAIFYEIFLYRCSFRNSIRNIPLQLLFFAIFTEYSFIANLCYDILRNIPLLQIFFTIFYGVFLYCRSFSQYFTEYSFTAVPPLPLLRACRTACCRRPGRGSARTRD